MKDKVFKLFLVFALVIGIFVNNSSVVHAGGTDGFYICNGDKGYLQYKYNSDTNKFERQGGNEGGNLELNEIHDNLQITLDDSNADEPKVTLELKGDVELSSYLESPNNGEIISSKVPLIINGNGHSLTFHCTPDANPERRTSARAFSIENYFEVNNLTINLFSEMKEKNCKSKDDDYEGFDFEFTGEDPTDAIAIFNNTTINSYTTTFVDSDDCFEIKLSGSTFNINFIQASFEQYGDASGFESYAFNTEGKLTLVPLNEKKSSIVVNAELINKSSDNGKKYEAVCSRYPLFGVGELSMTDSSLTINNKRNNARGLLFLHQLHAERSDVELNGGVVGIVVYEYREDEDKVVINNKDLYPARNIMFEDTNVRFTNLLSNIWYKPDDKVTAQEEVIIAHKGIPSKDNYLKIIGTDGTGDAPLSLNEQCLNITKKVNFGVKKQTNVSALVTNDLSKSISEYEEYVNGKTLLTFKALIIPGEGESAEEILRINTHGTTIIGYSDFDFDIEGDEDIDAFDEPTYDKDTNTITVKVLKDFTFTKEAEDDFDSFISFQGVNLKIVGDKTLTFDYELNTDLSDKQRDRFYFVSINEGCSFTAEGKSENEKLKLIVIDNTSREKQVKQSEVAAVMFHSIKHKAEPSLKENLNVITLKNVDLQADEVSTSLFNASAHSANINKSNVIYSYSPLNYEKEDKVNMAALSCIIIGNDLDIEQSNIEIDGDKSLKLTDDEIISGAIIARGTMNIKDCSKDNKIKVKGYNIGLFGTNVDITNSNLDVVGYAGGIISFDKVLISLSSKDGYVKIKSNLKEELDPSDFDITGSKYPAIYGAKDVIITPPEGSKVNAYDLNNTVGIFNRQNILNYRYVEIQAGNAPLDPTEIKEHNEGAPTKNSNGYDPYYEDEDRNYFEDPECTKPIEDLESWKGEHTVLAINDANNKYKKVTISPDQTIIKPITSNKYTFTSNADFDKFAYVLVDEKPISRLCYTLTQGSTIVNFTDDYINGLSEGVHTIHIVSNDGHGYNTFTVKKKSGGGGGGGSNPGYVVPKTGIK